MRHRFQQHQALGFGAGGEHEGIGGGVGGRQLAAAIQVADKAHVVVHAEPRRLPLQIGVRRAFAGDQKQQFRQGTAGERHGFQEKTDVFFMRHPADEQHHRPRRVDLVPGAESGTLARREGAVRQAGGQYVQRTGDAIVTQAFAHRGGRHNHRIQGVALAAREAPRQAA